ncbi:cupin domain-containing protein [Bailinhaonella thermotolerans]|uniref:Cupin domain-containing protein n=1 Tax=Bailinhaonella thermotolerans TaxID=1070861 RepID=A0A3A4B692_9ACTN|nr:cupin domain-containing protein [Bailinhaonella thermotolerans]RJL33044.1 cupin domain-containing protein [Bailinhaonella thermotolerans]
MVRRIEAPARIPVPGGKIIDEYVGNVSSGDGDVSIAVMQAPPGWEEPAQTPEFTEYTIVLRGSLVVETGGETLDVNAGQAIVTEPDERLRYTSGPDGADYIAICLPAFAEELAHRDQEPPDTSPGELVV